MPGLCATLVWLMAGLRMSTPHAQTEMRAMLMGLLDATIHLAFKLDVQIGNAALRAAVEMREALGAAKARQGDEQTGDEQAADACPAGDVPVGVVPGNAGPGIDSSNGDDCRTDQRGVIRRVHVSCVWHPRAAANRAHGRRAARGASCKPLVRLWRSAKQDRRRKSGMSSLGLGLS
jgi:hypothetical protein